MNTTQAGEKKKNDSKGNKGRRYNGKSKRLK